MKRVLPLLIGFKNFSILAHPLHSLGNQKRAAAALLFLGFQNTIKLIIIQNSTVNVGISKTLVFIKYQRQGITHTENNTFCIKNQNDNISQTLALLKGENGAFLNYLAAQSIKLLDFGQHLPKKSGQDCCQNWK